MYISGVCPTCYAAPKGNRLLMKSRLWLVGVALLRILLQIGHMPDMYQSGT